MVFEVTLAGSIAGALEASPRLHFTASDIGLASSFYLAGAVTGALGFGLALRLGREGVPIVIGSRDAGRAR